MTKHKSRSSTAAEPKPVMRLLDALGKRWALRILWELQHGPLTFRALQQAAGDLSPTVVSARLNELRELGIVERVDGEGYALSASGRELGTILLALNGWAEKSSSRS